MDKKRKQWLKWAFVLVMVAAIIYTFRDMVGPICEQLKQTKWYVIAIICVASFGYEVVEGAITTVMARRYQRDFRLKDGIISAFYISFYRVATLGSGAGVAGIYYFNQKGIEVFEGTGMYMVEYVLHKISIALFSGIMLIGSYSFIEENCGSYLGLLYSAYGITVLIAAGLLLVSASGKVHQIIHKILKSLNRSGRWDDKIGELEGQFEVLEKATRFLMGDKKLILSVVGLNLIKLACWYSIPYLILIEMRPAGILAIMAITSLSVVLAAVIPAPAGIGSTELVLTMLLGGVVSTDLAGSVTILYRFATFVFPFLIGSVVILKRKIKETATR